MSNGIDVFDGHCDTILHCCCTGEGLCEASGHLNLKRMGGYRHYAQFFAIFAEASMAPEKVLYQIFCEEYALFRREMEKNCARVVHCRSAQEAEQAFRSGRSAAFLSVEGAELLDCDLNRLEEAWKLGVRAVNLTWNHPNALSGTNLEEPERGLSPRGRAFAMRMQELGMLIDVSHLSDPGFWDVMELARKPVFASHSNSREVFFHTRNLTDSQFTAIIENHGVAGLNMYAAFLGDRPNLDTVIAHLEHFLALGGEKNVALGGDWDGCSALPEGIRGIQDLEKLYERLLRLNYSEALVRDLFYSNLMRVVREVCTI